jgi:hypothetical protein
MKSIQKAGIFAAFTNGVVAIATFYVAVVMIGLNVLGDRTLFVKIAINNPTPLLIMDALKCLTAACGVVLIIVLFKRLRTLAAMRMRIAALFGFLSILFLLSNAILSLIATTHAAEYAANNAHAGMVLNTLISILAMASIFINGIWYLSISLTGLKAEGMSRGLNYLGVTIGAINLIPIFGIVALLLTIVWSFWLGRVWAKGRW